MLDSRPELQAEPESLKVLIRSCKSKRTAKAYKYYLDNFLKWANKDYDSILFLTKREIEGLLGDYIYHLKNRISANSIEPYLFAIDKFLTLNDLLYNRKKVFGQLPERVKRQGDQAWSTEQISKILEYTGTTRNKLIVHVLAASGVRPRALTNLRFKDLIDMLHGCKALVCYSGTKWEYTTFVHAEAVKVLEAYKEERIKNGEMLTGESFVFLKNYQSLLTKPQGLTDSAIDSIISYMASKANVTRTKQGKALQHSSRNRV